MNNFINKIKEYKEVISLLIFFLGGYFWVLGYFATKTQLDELKSATHKNLEELKFVTQENLNMIQGKINLQFIDDMISENNINICKTKIELEKLKKNNADTTEINIKIAKLEDQKNQLIKSRDSAQLVMEKSLTNLTTYSYNK